MGVRPKEKRRVKSEGIGIYGQRSPRKNGALPMNSVKVEAVAQARATLNGLKQMQGINAD